MTLVEVRDAAEHTSVSTISVYTHVAVEDDGTIGNIFDFGVVACALRVSGREGHILVNFFLKIGLLLYIYSVAVIP